MCLLLFKFKWPTFTQFSTLSLHDALPISGLHPRRARVAVTSTAGDRAPAARAHPADQLRSEEHTSELQSRGHLVCRLLLVKIKELLEVDHSRVRIDFAGLNHMVYGLDVNL